MTNISNSVLATLVEQGDMVLDKLDDCARHYPDKVYLHYGEDGVLLTFSQVKALTDRMAAGLVELGLIPGQPVGVLTRNSLLVALSMFAIWRAGGVFAPVNYNFRGQLLAYQLNDSSPFALITDPSYADILAEVASDLELERMIIHHPAPQDHDFTGDRVDDLTSRFQVTDLALLKQSDAAVPQISRGPFDIANIVYTSGTTGPSKGVLQPFRWMNHYAFSPRSMTTHDDVLYCDLPMYHVGGAFYLVTRAVWQGNTVGLWDKFSPSRFWDRIEQCGASACNFMDVMVPWLMAAPPRPSDRRNTLNKVHMQPLPANHREVAERFGFDYITCGYGQTESGSVFGACIDEFGLDIHGTPPDLWKGLSKSEYMSRARELDRLVLSANADVPSGLMGRANPVFETAILDENDNVLAPGSIGQLALRPRIPGVMLLEYLGKPQATLKALKNCWFHTGDACRELADGTRRYVFVDRMGGFFRVRGENVSSFEIESLVTSHPKVRAAAAVPVKAIVGSEEEVAIFVELKSGFAMNEAELREHTMKVMPKYMQPVHIRFIQELPLTATSKIEKYKLKQMLHDELGIHIRSHNDV